MSKREKPELGKVIVNNGQIPASFVIILVCISGSSGLKAKQGHE